MTLWMVLHAEDGITGELILEEAIRLHLVAVVDLGEGRSTFVSPKIGDLSSEDLETLRLACFARVGLNDDIVRRRFVASRFYRDWQLERRRHPPLFRRRSDREQPRRAVRR